MKRAEENDSTSARAPSPLTRFGSSFSNPRPDAVTGLMSASTEVRHTSLSRLAEKLDEVEGEAAAAIGEQMRTSHALAVLLELVSEPEPATHQVALYVLGNLSSDVVDPASWKTKAAVRDLNGFERILPYAFSDDVETLFNALGAMQNLCSFPEYADLMRVR